MQIFTKKVLKLAPNFKQHSCHCAIHRSSSVIVSIGSIAEAQEWELKIIAVQEWLTEQDLLISSHLDHELTVDDLPDESQVWQKF